MSLAKINGVFRLTRDTSITYTASGTAVAKLGLACSEKFGDKETQLFIDATAFGKQGEILNQYAGVKGTQIFLSGKLQTESWEKDGQKQYKTTMIIESFDFIGNKQQNEQQPQQRQPQQQAYRPQQQQYQQPAQPHTAYRQPQQQQYQIPDPRSLPSIDIDMDEPIPF